MTGSAAAATAAAAGSARSRLLPLPASTQRYAVLLLALLARSLVFAPAPAPSSDAGAGVLSPSPPPPPPRDLYAPIAELVTPHGYPLEEHFVTTADGYILRAFRIPHGAGNATTTSSSNSSSSTTTTTTAPRPIALLQHALMDSAAGFLLLGPRRALALRLADAGFDVWLANSRGNTYSRNHTDAARMPADGGGNGINSAAFWRFTFTDMADHDVPALAAAALNASASAAANTPSPIVYFGYSQGAAIGLAALASQPALASGVRLAVLLAPVALPRRLRSAPFALSTAARLDRAALAAGASEWGAASAASGARMRDVCARWPRLCLAPLTAMCGANPRGNIDHGLLGLLYQHLPAGTSALNMAHWAQLMRRRGQSAAASIPRYDWGRDCGGGGGGGHSWWPFSWGASAAARSGGAGGGSASPPPPPPRCNREAYGVDAPPEYALAAITTPLALFTGGRDTLAVPADIEALKAALAPGTLVRHSHNPHYAHLDYELGSDVQPSYDEMIELAVKYVAPGAGGAGGAAAA